MFVCCSSIYYVLLHLKTKNEIYLERAFDYIVIYCLIDIFFARPVIILHHIFVFLMWTVKYSYLLDMSRFSTIIITLLNTEISTIFLVFKSLFKNTNISFLQKLAIYNDLLFVITFMKYRVYDFHVNIVQNPNTYELIEPNDIWKTIHIYSGICGIYLLNLYWGVYILKKVYCTIFYHRKNREHRIEE